jgi:D-amino-acid dehydrogenase
MKALRWLMMKHAPLILRPRPDMAMLRWLGQMLGQCNARDYAINKSRMVRLAEFSRDCLIELRQDFGIAYDERSQGTLQLFREEKQLDGMAKDIAVLEQDGVPFEVLDRAGCLAAEPGWRPALRLLRAACACPMTRRATASNSPMLWPGWPAGRVCFHYGTAIHGLVEQGGRITHVRTSRGDVAADAFWSPWAASRRSWWRLWGCACRSIR